jgi:hypothetical protein
VGLPLNLGKHGPYNRHIYYFNYPSGMRGQEIRDRLEMENVFYKPTGATLSPTPFTPPPAMAGGTQTPTRGLNIVRDWDAPVVSLIVLLPVIISFCVSVTWSIVATLHFKLDPQTSTQTGFTIGSYVVTAGKSQAVYCMPSSSLRPKETLDS